MKRMSVKHVKLCVWIVVLSPAEDIITVQFGLETHIVKPNSKSHKEPKKDLDWG